jgi:ABC-2 type transport system ATP-binding protein
MIEVHQLTKRYGAITAVDGLSFAVPPGRVTGFLGPNGAGKSATLRMILGLARPTGGTATIDGRPYRAPRRPLRHVGALLDATAVPAGRSAYHHLAALAHSNGISRAGVHAALAEVGLTQVAAKRVGGFSLGMKQRLGIAAALLGYPPVMIFDEPLNGLDPDGIRWIRRLFTNFARQGHTVLVSSHLMSEMQTTADHLIVIGRGRLIADTSTSDFVDRAARRYVAVRSPNGGELARLLLADGAQVDPGDGGELRVTGPSPEHIGDLARTHGLGLHGLSVRSASLEEAFMAMTADAVDYHTAATADGRTRR